MLPLPAGVAPAAHEPLPTSPWPWLTMTALLGVVALSTLEANLWVLPTDWQAWLHQLTAGMRLYTWATVAAPHQLWTHALLHDTPWHLISTLAAGLLVGPTVERRLGPGALLVLALFLAPVSTLIWLLDGSPPPSLGPAGVLAGLCGAAMALQPTARWRLWWLFMLPGQLRLVRTDLPLGIVVGLYLGQELARELLQPVLGGPGPHDVLLPAALNLVLCVVTGGGLALALVPLRAKAAGGAATIEDSPNADK